MIFIPLAALLLMPAPIFPRWPFDWTRANTFASISTNPLSMEHCWSSFRYLRSSCQCLPSLLPELFLRPPDCLLHCSGSPPASVSPVIPPLPHLLHLVLKWWPLQRCYLLLSLLFSTLSLHLGGVSQVHASTAPILVLNVGQSAYFTSESPRFPQVFLPWIFCSLPHATNPKPSISLPFCTGARTAVFLWSFLRYSIGSSFF